MLNKKIYITTTYHLEHEYCTLDRHENNPVLNHVSHDIKDRTVTLNNTELEFFLLILLRTSSKDYTKNMISHLYVFMC